MIFIYASLYIKLYLCLFVLVQWRRLEVFSCFSHLSYGRCANPDVSQFRSFLYINICMYMYVYVSVYVYTYICV